MEELKKIIGTFVKKNAEDIYEGTLINNTAIPGSIMVHRMYAIMNKAGYSIKNYAGINSYGDLINRLNDSERTSSVSKRNHFVNAVTTVDNEEKDPIVAIGIDIEHVDNLPRVPDFREDEFYLGNFTKKEISYALLKQQTYETLSGLFCAKEALCKANSEIRTLPFNQIEIEHSNDGKPMFNNFSLSISHANGFSIAVAVKNQVSLNSDLGFKSELSKNIVAEQKYNTDAVSSQKNKYIVLALVVSIAISLILLFILLEENFSPGFPHHI